MRRFLRLFACFAWPFRLGFRFPAARATCGELLQWLGLRLKIYDVPPSTWSADDWYFVGLWQTRQIPSPPPRLQGRAASVASYTYGTTNNQLVDLSRLAIFAPANGTQLGAESPITPSAALQPAAQYGAYHSLESSSRIGECVTSNPVEVYVHAL